MTFRETNTANGRSDQPESIPVERLLTLREAADSIGVPLFAMRKAAKSALVPIYRVVNGRQRLKLSELIAAIHAAAQGDAK